MDDGAKTFFTDTAIEGTNESRVTSVMLAGRTIDLIFQEVGTVDMSIIKNCTSETMASFTDNYMPAIHALDIAIRQSCGNIKKPAAESPDGISMTYYIPSYRFRIASASELQMSIRISPKTYIIERCLVELLSATTLDKFRY